MSKFIRNDRVTSFPTLPDSLLKDLARASALMRCAPLDVEILTKLADISTFSIIMWGQQKTEQAFYDARQENMPNLDDDELDRAEKHPHGERGVVQELGDDLFLSVCGRLKKINPEFDDLLHERESYDLLSCNVLRFVSKSHTYEKEERAKSTVPEDLARAHYFFGKANPTNQTGCPQRKQAAVAMVGSMLWGVDGWQKYLEEVNDHVKQGGNIIARLLGAKGYTQWLTDVEDHDDEGLGYATTAVRQVVKAIAQIEKNDTELEKMLRWNIVEPGEEVEQIEELKYQQQGEEGEEEGEDEDAQMADRAEDEIRSMRASSCRSL